MKLNKLNKIQFLFMKFRKMNFSESNAEKISFEKSCKDMNSKKGQLTIFLIISIIAVILLIIGVIAFYNSREKQKQNQLETFSINNYVSKCLEEVAEKGIILAGLQGGYINVPEYSVKAEFSTVAYHHYLGNNIMPDKNTIEKEISFYVENTIDLCFNASEFSKFGYTIEKKGNITAETTIKEDSVSVIVNYPHFITKDNSNYTTDKFITNVPIRLGHIHNIVKAINEKIFYNPEWIDLTFISSFDVRVDVIPYDNDSIIYILKDPGSKGNYVFMFASLVKKNKAPAINIPDELVFEEGRLHTYWINATDPENDTLTYSEDTDLFDILDDGHIIFMPSIPGTYNVIITVDDGHHNAVSKAVKFIIKNTTMR